MSFHAIYSLKSLLFVCLFLAYLFYLSLLFSLTLAGNCKPGEYLNITAGKCQSCPLATYNDVNNLNESCTKCPTGNTTLQTGSASINSCNICKYDSWTPLQNKWLYFGGSEWYFCIKNTPVLFTFYTYCIANRVFM